MQGKVRSVIKSVFRRLSFKIKSKSNPELFFHSHNYLRHTARRLEHLSSLSIPVKTKSVLEIGAGIGDHSHYYIDRGCKITITEAREENLKYLRSRYPKQKVVRLDMESPGIVEGAPFDIIHCYGLLYHLSNPREAIDYLSENTNGILFLETCVSFDDNMGINHVTEGKYNPTQAKSGIGCRPSRNWVYTELKSKFKYVYLPRTQPCHPEFPTDWEDYGSGDDLKRAIFIASHIPIENRMLVQSYINKQEKHE